MYIYIYIYLSIPLYIYIYVYISITIYIYIYLSLYISLSLSISLSIHIYIYIYIYIEYIYTYICIYIYIGGREIKSNQEIGFGPFLSRVPCERATRGCGRGTMSLLTLGGGSPECAPAGSRVVWPVPLPSRRVDSC